MERRTVIATAAAAFATVLSGSAAIAANLGILNSSQDPVGKLSPVADAVEIADIAPGDGTTTTLPAQVETIYVDEDVPQRATDAPAAVPKADDSTAVHEEEHEHEGYDDDD